MPEDLVKLVQDLINSGKGDVNRLGVILETLQKGEQLYPSDQRYFEDLTSETLSDKNVDLPAENSALTPNIENPSPIPNTENPPPITNTENTPLADSPKNMVESHVGKKSVSKKKVAVAGIIIAIIVLSYVGLDAYAVSSLQFRPHLGGPQSVVSETELRIQAESCNPSYFPATFHYYQIEAFYKSESVEKAIILGNTISPKSASILDGLFIINKDVVMKFSNENQPFDPSQAHVTTTVDAPIFGFIPFAVKKDYVADDFARVLKTGVGGPYNC